MNEMYAVVYRCPVCGDAQVQYQSSLRSPEEGPFHHHPGGGIHQMVAVSWRSLSKLDGPLAHYQLAADGSIRQLAEVTETPTHLMHVHTRIPTKEDTMTYDPYEGLIPQAYRQYFGGLLTPPKLETPEELFAKLDVQPGDRVRLTELNGKVGARTGRRQAAQDAATLEGIVEAVKKKNGESKVKIKGFAVAGNGIFWPVKDYRVEVLHRAYRWTDEDRVFAELVPVSARHWELLSEAEREHQRKRLRPRLENIRKALGVPNTEVE